MKEILVPISIALSGAFIVFANMFCFVSRRCAETGWINFVGFSLGIALIVIAAWLLFDGPVGVRGRNK